MLIAGWRTVVVVRIVMKLVIVCLQAIKLAWLLVHSRHHFYAKSADKQNRFLLIKHYVFIAATDDRMIAKNDVMLTFIHLL